MLTFIQVSDLFAIFALDPVKDREEMKEENKKLTVNCQAAQAAIGRLVDEDRDKFNARIEERRKMVDAELSNLVASPDQASVKAITEAVQEVVAEEKDNTYSNVIDLEHFY